MILLKEKLLELYPYVKEYAHIYYTDPRNKKDFLTNYLPSKLWRLNNLYKIIDKEGNLVTFRMNYSQHVVYSKMFIHPRLVILKSRQQGISTFWLINFLDDALFLPNLNVGLMSQGIDESALLLQRLARAWEYLNEDIKNFLSVKNIKSNEKTFGLSNGSTVFIRVSFRSATLQRLHISELAKIANLYPDRAKETKTGSLQTIGRNPAIIESTGEGDNMFKQVWDSSFIYFSEGRKLTRKDFLPVFLPWFQDPDCWEEEKQEANESQIKYFNEIENKSGVKLKQEQKNFWIAQYRELEEDIYSEYPSFPDEAFLVSNEGYFYATLYKNFILGRNRVVSDLYDPNIPVRVAFDLGIDDYLVILFYQIYKNKLMIIDEFVCNDELIDFYINYVKNKPYKYDKLVLPHDSTKRNLLTKGSVYDRFLDAGFNVERLENDEEINIGIDRVKTCIKQYIWIDSKCAYIKDCFLNYKRKWDEKLGVWKTNAVKNIYCHGADTIRYMCRDAMYDLEYRENYKQDISRYVNKGFEI